MASITRRECKGGVRYRAEIRMTGHPPVVQTFTKKTDAKRWATQTEAAIREGRYFRTREAQRHSMGEALSRYVDEFDLRGVRPKERTLLRKYCTFWRDLLGPYLLSDISPAMIAGGRDRLLTDGLAPATVGRYMSGLSRVYSAALRDWAWVEESPMNKVTKPSLPRGRVRYLSDDERERLLTACKESTNPQLYPAVLIALSTGMRKSELMNLRWRDVDLNTGRAILHQTKNGERRTVTVTGKALELLREHSKVRLIDSDLLFPGRNRQKPIDLRKPWIAALKKASITDMRWHDLRHSTASYLTMNGASLLEVAEVLGHKTIQMTQRYSHLSEDHVAGVLEDMTRIFDA